MSYTNLKIHGCVSHFWALPNLCPESGKFQLLRRHYRVQAGMFAGSSREKISVTRHDTMAHIPARVIYGQWGANAAG